MSKNYLYAEQFWNFQYLMVFISTDTPPPQICSGFMELCQAMSHLDPSGTSLSWADHLSKHVETCRISIPHLHFICIISHISTDSKKIKKEEVVLSEPWTQQAQTWFQSFHLGYATGDSSKYRYRCQVRSQSFNYQDTCKQSYKSNLRMQRHKSGTRMRRALFALNLRLGLIRSDLHTSASTPDPAFLQSFSSDPALSREVKIALTPNMEKTDATDIVHGKPKDEGHDKTCHIWHGRVPDEKWALQSLSVVLHIAREFLIVFAWDIHCIDIAVCHMMKSMPLNARLVRPHLVNDEVGAHGVGVEKVGNAGQRVAKEKSATFYPHFPQTCCWGSWISSFANVMLQMDQAV